MVFDVEQRMVDFAEYLADEARKVIIPHYRKQVDIENKADSTPVTEVDKRVEEVIRKLIEINYPEHGIIGEEYGEAKTNAEFIWVVDPIDGTKSFIAGRPLFGTLISLVREEKPILGLIDQPILSERWLGVNGQTKFNNRKIQTRFCDGLANAYFVTTSPHAFEGWDMPRIDKITKAAGCSIYGGDCYAYGQLAMGLVDAVVESGLKNYDFCALVPVIENAGGKITDWEGRELKLNSRGKILATGDAALHEKIKELLV